MSASPLRRWLRHMFLMQELRNMQHKWTAYEMFDRRLRAAGKMLVTLGGKNEKR